MSKKLGVDDDHQKGKNELNDEQKNEEVKRGDVDTRAARQQIAGMINENYQRLNDFDDHERESVKEEDLEEQQFSNPLALN